MKTEQTTLITSIVAAVDLSASKNLFIGFSGAICTVDAKALGVLNDDTPLGEQAPVAVSGIALVVTGGAIALGVAVSSDAAGKAVTGVAGFVNGYSLDSASAANQLIRIKLV